MIKALFFDIDGTLISFKTHRPPDSARAALEEAKRRGVLLFVATGRNTATPEERAVLAGLPEFDGHVTLNGHYCFLKDGEEVFKDPLDPEDVATMVKLCRETPFPCKFAEAKDHYLSSDEGRVKEFYGIVQVKPPRIMPAEYAQGREIFSATPFLTEAEEGLFLPFLKHSDTTRWHPYITDVVPRGGGKELGVGRMLERFGIAPGEAAVFGDGGNDLSMIENAVNGVAMGDGDERLRAAASYVTDSCDEDGIWNALKHFGII